MDDRRERRSSSEVRRPCRECSPVCVTTILQRRLILACIFTSGWRAATTTPVEPKMNRAARASSQNLCPLLTMSGSGVAAGCAAANRGLIWGQPTRPCRQVGRAVYSRNSLHVLTIGRVSPLLRKRPLAIRAREPANLPPGGKIGLMEPIRDQTTTHSFRSPTSCFRPFWVFAVWCSCLSLNQSTLENKSGFRQSQEGSRLNRHQRATWPGQFARAASTSTSRIRPQLRLVQKQRGYA